MKTASPPWVPPYLPLISSTDTLAPQLSSLWPPLQYRCGGTVLMTLMYEGPDPSYTVIWVSLTTLNQKKTREFYNANLYLKFHHKTFAKYNRSRCKDSRSKFQGSIADLDPLSLILQWFKISYCDLFCTISKCLPLLRVFSNVVPFNISIRHNCSLIYFYFFIVLCGYIWVSYRLPHQVLSTDCVVFTKRN